MVERHLQQQFRTREEVHRIFRHPGCQVLLINWQKHRPLQDVAQGGIEMTWKYVRQREMEREEENANLDWIGLYRLKNVDVIESVRRHSRHRHHHCPVQRRPLIHVAEFVRLEDLMRRMKEVGMKWE